MAPRGARRAPGRLPVRDHSMIADFPRMPYTSRHASLAAANSKTLGTRQPMLAITSLSAYQPAWTQGWVPSSSNVPARRARTAVPWFAWRRPRGSMIMVPSDAADAPPRSTSCLDRGLCANPSAGFAVSFPLRNPGTIAEFSASPKRWSWSRFPDTTSTCTDRCSERKEGIT
jgi:hypothetical protein